MNPKFLSWNISGLGAKEKRVLVKRGIRDSHALIFFSSRNQNCLLSLSWISEKYSEETQSRPFLDNLSFSEITPHDAGSMESNFTEAEIYSVIKDLGQEKAPALDGLPLIFFTNCWYIIKSDVLAVIKDFCENETLDWRLNATFLALIPKKDQVEDITDFRPISLIHCITKIISKVLATRLKRVISSLVSDSQSAYVQGRQILDGALIANELIDSKLNSNSLGVICKIDLEKAFDRVNWGYIDYILDRMGFGRKWRNWIHLCLSTANFSILLNGTPCGFFKSERGVRQGDPLSPLLFILAMEGLSKMLQRATDLGHISGFQTSATGTMISHLHYADDTILFLDADFNSIHYALSIMNCFEVVTGLKINFSKTQLIGMGNVPHLDRWASDMGFSVSSLPFNYLGVPIGANPRTEAIWDPIIAKFDKHLSFWQKNFLSSSGRLTLLKSVLASTPVTYSRFCRLLLQLSPLLKRK